MASSTAGQEDIVHYRVFVPISVDPEKDNDIVEYLSGQRDQMLAHLSRFCMNYIWQVEPFSLRVTPRTADVPAHIFGSTYYADNVEDEWYIVSLLIELSKEFKDAVISVQDTDGEFLLIEAADHLPKWLNPDTAENKVFFYRGSLHIVPRSVTVSSLSDSVDYIRKNSSSTLGGNGIQQAISKRLAGYPQKSQEHLHRCHCYVPAALAAALDHTPALIAPIIQAFYHRDPVDLKSCVTFRHFRPGTRVMSQVVMTRCLYAQLMQQQFSADRRSGYTVPPTNSPKFKAHDLGMKIAHGAEILCSKFSIDDVKAEDANNSLKSDSCYQRFLESLKAKGFFKGELEGSQLYKTLLNDAMKFYKTSVAVKRSDSSDTGKRILSIIKSATFDIEEMRKEEKNLPPADDDSWINITPEQLDEMLNNAYSRHLNPVSDVQKVADRMKAFVEQKSGHEGVEFHGNDDDVQFDPSSFMQTMQKIFEFDDPDSASSSDLDEYESEDDLEDMYSKHAANGKKSTNKKPVGKQTDTKPAASKLPAGGATKSGKANDNIGDFLGMKDYMEAMDRELAKTAVGTSFIRQGDNAQGNSSQPKPPPRRRKQNAHLTATPNNTPTLSSTLHTAMGARARAVHDIDDEDDDFQPVDIDMNAVKNILESYESQHGLPGPATNILGGMGVRLPPPAGKR